MHPLAGCTYEGQWFLGDVRFFCGNIWEIFNFLFFFLSDSMRPSRCRKAKCFFETFGKFVNIEEKNYFFYLRTRAF
jgi:hypothetical protein